MTKLVRLEPGHYVVAVSGGVDSMALLHMLSELKGQGSHNFVVAHFDHGIRDDSHIDRALVNEISHEYGMPFVYEEGVLGPGASESDARDARYEFLRKVQAASGARGIVTAHHHDDTIETAVINMMRGTGRKGLSSLKQRDGIYRPLLKVPKITLKNYAQSNGLTWHEDSTNTNQDYKRNYIRHSVLPKAKLKSKKDYNKLLTTLKRQRDLNEAIDNELATILHIQPSRLELRRRDVILLPYNVATELVAEWLRQNGKRQLSKWLVDRITIAVKTAQPNTEILLDGSSKVIFGKSTAEFVPL